MIITCPHCQTKYQVTYEAIGSAGRKVQCANCQQAWQQQPLEPGTQEDKQIFTAIEEDGLDEAMAAEERDVAAEVAQRAEAKKQAEAATTSGMAAKTDAAMARKRQMAFMRRQSARKAELPLARLRRSLRIVGFGLLAAVLATTYFGRVEVVKRFPDMAAVYEAVGLSVNVVGLDFSNVSALRTLHDGKEVLIVSAQIFGQRSEPVTVPSVMVTLIDGQGRGIYEWSVSPAVRNLMAGERATFDTQLTLPPGDAARIRLSFAGEQSPPVKAAGPRPAEVPAGAETQHAIASEQH